MNKRRTYDRNRKRQLLQVAILLASPVVAFHTISVAVADTASETTQRIVPPLPAPQSASAATSSKSNSQVKAHVNPFCQPVSTDSAAMPKLGFALPLQSPIQLTSNEGESNQTEAQPEPLVQPVQVAPKRNRWVPPADANIQPKPIQEGRDSLTFAGALDSSNESPVVDNEVSFNPAKPEMKASVKAPSTKPKTEAKPSTHEELPPLPAPVHVNGKAKDSGAVSFSLNDDTLVETSVESAKPTSAAAKATSSNKPSMAPLLSHGTSESIPPVVISKSKSVPAQPASMQLPKPPAVTPIQSNRFANDPEVVIQRGSSKQRTHLVPLAEPEALHPVAVSATPDRRIVRGGRPAVDVGVPPVMIERSSTSSGPLVEAVAELNPANAQKVAFAKEFESDQVVVLDLKCTEVRALKLEHAISKVQVGDSAVCAAVAAGPTQVQLIGAKDGVTRLAVWTSSSSGQETKSVYEVRVGQSDAAAAGSPQSVAAQLSKTLQTAFPDSKLVVRAESEQLVVEGVCSNDQSAKKALRMIRSACLMPVVDKVTIR